MRGGWGWSSSKLPWNVMKSIILALIAVFAHVSLVTLTLLSLKSLPQRKSPLGIRETLTKELSTQSCVTFSLASMLPRRQAPFKI